MSAEAEVEETTANAVKRKPLFTPKEFQLLEYFEQCFLVKGALPSVVTCEHMGFSERFVTTLLKKPAFLKACEERGLPIKKYDPDGDRLNVGILGTDKSFILSAEQLAVANAMLDLQDTRSQKKKLQDLGVTTKRYNAWLREASFQHYLRERSEALLGDSLSEAHAALLDRVRAGDISAIKFYYEMTGRYVAAKAGVNNLDIMALMNMFVEVIQRHVHDQATLIRISDDLLSLAKAGAMAQGIETIANAPTVNGIPQLSHGQLTQPRVVNRADLAGPKTPHIGGMKGIEPIIIAEDEF